MSDTEEIIVLSRHGVTDRIFRQNRNGGFQLVLGCQALWQEKSTRQQEKGRRNLVVEVKIKPFTQLKLEPLLRHAE